MTEINWTEEELTWWVKLLNKRAPTLPRVNAQERDKRQAKFYNQLLTERIAARKKAEAKKVKDDGKSESKKTN